MPDTYLNAGKVVPNDYTSINLPTVVVAAYNRERSLVRLLESISKARYPTPNVRIVISIDASKNENVKTIARDWEWQYGSKEIIEHTDHLGLKNHLIFCGSLSQTYGSVIVLEDDLLVSPEYYQYALAAKNYYDTDECIAGVSLYKYHFTEHYLYPFYPVNDGSDVHFIQMPSSWGQLFTKKQWSDFYVWYLQNPTLSNLVPEYVKTYWSDDSWKKHYLDYLINTKKYFVFPNYSYTTNFHEEGTNSKHTGLFQADTAIYPRLPIFRNLTESNSVYDSYFEPAPEIIKASHDCFRYNDFEVDFYGSKPIENIRSEYLLSSKHCINPIKQFGFDLPNPIQNILHNLEGDFFSFGLKRSFESNLQEPLTFHRNFVYMNEVLFANHNSAKIEFEAQKMLNNWMPEVYKDIYSSVMTNRDFPRFFCGTFISDQNDLNFDDIKAISDYPASQIIFKTFSVKDDVKKIAQEINSSEASYFVFLKQGELRNPKTFATVNAIFQKYPDINWLTGIQTITTPSGFQVNSQTTPSRRWSEHIFHRSLYGQTGRHIPSGATFFKRYLWDLAKDELNITSMQTFCEDLWAAFFKYQKLYTVDAYLSTSVIDKQNLVRYNKKSDLLETKPVNRIMEWFFLRNIPVLRAYYKERNELAPVVRYDFKTQSHWLSDY